MIQGILVGVVVVALTAWGSCALRFRAPLPVHWAWGLVVLWWALALGALLGLVLRDSWMGWPYWVVAVGLLVWWIWGVKPSNDRDWIPEVARQSHGEIAGDGVVLHNVRNFRWRTAEDYDVRWETRSYDLARLESVDLVLSTWGRPAIAHAMVSFGFGQDEYLVFSVEIRRKRGDAFSEIGGFFRLYELAILASTEEDSLRVRTHVRGEEGYLYRVRVPLDSARKLFVSYVEAANALQTRPRFYNTLTANCSTIVWRLAHEIIHGLPLDRRLLLSGYLPEYLAQLQALQSDDVACLRQRGHYTLRALAANSQRDYSRVIRQGVPGVEPCVSGDEGVQAL